MGEHQFYLKSNNSLYSLPPRSLRSLRFFLQALETLQNLCGGVLVFCPTSFDGFVFFQTSGDVAVLRLYNP